MTSSLPPGAGAPRTCAACGAAGSGNFCGNCGATLGPRACVKCQAELSAQARFCHRCGATAPGPHGGRSERTAWIIAGTVVALLLAVIGYRMLTDSPTQRVPDMANAGNAGPGQVGLDPGGSLPTGPAPDISGLTRAERFIRLNNRVMEAAAAGDSASVVNFTPMALGAYSQLDAITNDDRYHAAVLNAQIGRVAQALALTDTMLAEVPGYLLAFVVRGDIAEFQRDSAALQRARADFRAAYDGEIAARRAEYVDHRNVLDDFRGRSTAP